MLVPSHTAGFRCRHARRVLPGVGSTSSRPRPSVRFRVPAGRYGAPKARRTQINLQGPHRSTVGGSGERPTTVSWPGSVLARHEVRIPSADPFATLRDAYRDRVPGACRRRSRSGADRRRSSRPCLRVLKKKSPPVRRRPGCRCRRRAEGWAAPDAGSPSSSPGACCPENQIAAALCASTRPQDRRSSGPQLRRPVPQRMSGAPPSPPPQQRRACRILVASLRPDLPSWSTVNSTKRPSHPYQPFAHGFFSTARLHPPSSGVQWSAGCGRAPPKHTCVRSSKRGRRPDPRRRGHPSTNQCGLDLLVHAVVDSDIHVPTIGSAPMPNGFPRGSADSMLRGPAWDTVCRLAVSREEARPSPRCVRPDYSAVTATGPNMEGRNRVPPIRHAGPRSHLVLD